MPPVFRLLFASAGTPAASHFEWSCASASAPFSRPTLRLQSDHQEAGRKLPPTGRRSRSAPTRRPTRCLCVLRRGAVIECDRASRRLVPEGYAQGRRGAMVGPLSRDVAASGQTTCDVRQDRALSPPSHERGSHVLGSWKPRDFAGVGCHPRELGGERSVVLQASVKCPEACQSRRGFAA